MTKPGLFAWTRKGALAIMDQAVWAGTHFLANVLLARWLDPDAYGAFALAYSAFLLVAALHSALLAEPMIILGVAQSDKQFRRYVGQLVAFHALLAFPMSFLSLAVAFFLDISLLWIFVGLTIAAPFLLLLWLLRRAFYLLFQPGWALLGGAFYLLLLSSSVCGLQVLGKLSGATAFLAIGLSAAIISILFLVLLQPVCRGVWCDEFDTTVRAHLGYGRWAIGTAFLTWVPANLYFLVLPAWFGLEAVGSFRALLNISLPVAHVIAALSYLLYPVLTAKLKEGRDEMNRTAALSISALILLATANFAVLIFLGDRALFLLYGGRYLHLAPLIPLAALTPIFACVTAVLEGGLKAQGRPDSVFWAHLVSAGLALTIGLLLTAKFGLPGAIGSMAILSLITGGMVCLFFLQDRPPRSIGSQLSRSSIR